MTLRERIEQAFSQDPGTLDRSDALQAFSELKFFLNVGDVRTAQPSTHPSDPGGWVVNDWVKKGILLGFRLGELTDMSINREFHFFDKSSYPLKKMNLDNEIRLVPGGSSIRDGAFIARRVVVMPPAYINVGAYIDEGTMVDSHALVGSCAQVGKRVHVSAAAQIGGVLEPVGAMPVIVEDDVFVGGNCGIYEGTIVKQRAVLAPGVILTGSTTVFDVVHGKEYRRSGSTPLIIPEGAVVIPGSRPLRTEYALQRGLSAYAPIIIKYRDANTDAATALEGMLR